MDQSHLGSREIKNVFSPDACNLCIEELSDIRLSLTHTVLNFDRFLHRVTRITRIFITNYFISKSFHKFHFPVLMQKSNPVKLYLEKYDVLYALKLEVKSN